MNKKAQGLPLNFIVLAAIAILILILVVGFVIGGGSSIGRTISPQVARQNCEDFCADMKAEASGLPSTSSVTKTLFCTTQEWQGGTGDCPSIGVQCYVTYNDGIQKQVTCT